MYGQKKAMIKKAAPKKAAPKKAATSPAAVKGNLKRIGAGDPNYVKDMIKRGKSKPKPGMMK
jgi:hypothetical protein